MVLGFCLFYVFFFFFGGGEGGLGFERFRIQCGEGVL